MRLRSFSGLIAVVVSATALATAAWGGEPIDERRSAAPEATISIENLQGSITVEGWGKNEAEITGTLSKDAKQLKIAGSDDRIKIEVVMPKNRHFKNIENTDLIVKVPRASSVRVSTVNATIDVSAVEGHLEIEAVNGDITTAGEPQSVEIECVNGDIEIGGAKGRVEVESVSGEIILNDIEGDLTAESVSGDIEILGGRLGEIECATVSGDIQLDADLDENGSFEFESHSGTIALILPFEISADFEIETFSGDIDGLLPAIASRVDQKDFVGPGKELDFTVGSGNAHIMVTTFSGTITLSRVGLIRGR